jgi:hypothetical protein
MSIERNNENQICSKIVREYGIFQFFTHKKGIRLDIWRVFRVKIKNEDSTGAATISCGL